MLLLFFVSATLQCNAQRGKIGLAVETDPISTVFGAKTFLIEPHEIDHWSWFVNVVSADFPKWMDDLLNPKNKTIGLETKIKPRGGFAIDYFLKAKKNGCYLGVINLLSRNSANSGLESKECPSSLSHNINPRFYRPHFTMRISFQMRCPLPQRSTITALIS